MFMAAQRRRRGQAQSALIAFVIEYKKDHNGISPSYREIAEAMDYGSKSAAYNVVMSIVAKNRPGYPTVLEIDEGGRIIVSNGEFILKSPR